MLRLAVTFLGLLLVVSPGVASTDVDRLPPDVVSALAGIVGISVKEVITVPRFRHGHFSNEELEGVGAGSGVIISSDGLTVTNAHVVAGAVEVRVRFSSGVEETARLLSLDEASDLALLKIPGTGFDAIPLADGEVPAAGTPAFVVGNRDGLGHEIAWARIGPHKRVRVGARPLEFWAEVDAPVGPGNSGGALLNTDGELLGIPSLLIEYTEDGPRASPLSAGLFIPVDHVRRSLHQMRQGPLAVWPWLGLLLKDSLLANSAGVRWNDTGVRVSSVFPGSPADGAGFAPGDRIVAVGARRVHDNFEALDAVLNLAIGSGTTVSVERGGALLSIETMVGVRPPDPRPAALVDLALHTGLQLHPEKGESSGPPAFTFDSMSKSTRRHMPAIEAELFDEGPTLGSLLPGRDLLEGGREHVSVASLDHLSSLLRRCFVHEQFVALIHWELDGRKTLDRVHVHRKVYPAII